ncbi:MAG: UDP-N-acetylmuramate--L-alanine ligase [Patescibacteria group bacterium]
MKKEPKNQELNFAHFIGIGGISMSALARYFVARGMRVSGSDIVSSEVTKELRKEGIQVVIGHKQNNIKKGVDLVVYNRAIEPSNPELIAAKRLGIKTIPLADAIGELTRQYETIAITGAHGKSTTTALIGLILARASLNPTVFVGTNLKEFGGKNIRIGKSSYLVLEADDFDRAFLRYSPTIEVITNIDSEHLDTYKNLAGARKAFLEFIALTIPGGALVLNRDNENLSSLAKDIQKIAHKNNLNILWYSLKNQAAKKIKKVIRIPGEHNVSNAVAAYTLAHSLGIHEKIILAAIAAYRGSWRRFEYRGEFEVKSYKLKIKSPVYDDYAHHPTEVKATLQGFKERFPNKNIICVFQPHQGLRLRLLFDEFIRAFDAADTVIITSIYKVPGRDETLNELFSPEALVRAMQKKYPRKPIFYLSNFKNLKNAINILMTEPPVCGLPAGSPAPKIKPAVIVMTGAGDIVQYTDTLLNPKP